MSNPNHDPKTGEFTFSSGGGDIAQVNIPISKRGDLNAQIDRSKRADAAQKRHTQQAISHQRKLAKSLLVEHGQKLVEKFGHLGPGLNKKLEQMAQWEPSKFIGMVEKFKRE